MMGATEGLWGGEMVCPLLGFRKINLLHGIAESLGNGGAIVLIQREYSNIPFIRIQAAFFKVILGLNRSDNSLRVL